MKNKLLSLIALLSTFILSCSPPIAHAGASVAGDKAAQQFIPANAYRIVPMLDTTIQKKWPSLVNKQYIAGQIEQETCISLKHSKCFTSKAELKTSREHGMSFGQFTIAYDAKGKVRFDAMAEVRALDKDLINFTEANRYDENLGLIAIVVRDKQEFLLAKGASSETDQFAFAFSAYNGGRGSVLKDRRLCAATGGCDQSKWFGHVENTSYKSKVAAKGYGQSWFAINRGYVSNIIYVRSPKYLPLFKNVQG